MAQREAKAENNLPLTRKAMREAALATQQEIQVSQLSDSGATPPANIPQAPVMTRAMLRARQESVPSVAPIVPVSAFDEVVVPEFDLSDPRDAMCHDHAQESAAYSRRAQQQEATAKFATRASRRDATPVIMLDSVPTWDAVNPLTDAEPEARKAAKPTRANRGRLASKVAVLASLAMATVAAPVALAHSPEPEAEPVAEEAPVQLVGPSTAEVVASPQHVDAIPSGIAQQTSVDDRVVQVAARSDIRTPLSGCDSSQSAPGENGQLDVKDLCSVKRGHTLRADAAVAFLALDEAYQAKFGTPMCLTDAYRPLETQRTLKIQKGSLAATPGTSNHGWGLAVDICNTTYHAQNKWEWLNENAPRFGWAQPSWASRSYEPWHWEFTDAVQSQRAN
ncbi:M15 family metallopeptidase [Jonesiaceae bacterium BS-20]|uniref:M15 family metallopeptidase n=1 Tax=Jonesiaceae bacterium BS-20 TaxID=3120821 RepID=A0AAU7DYM4_9MICO